MGDSKSLEIEINNVSQDYDGGDSTLTDLTLLAIELAGPDDPMFFVKDFVPGTVLSKGQSVTLHPCFAPTEGTGARFATMTIVTDQGAAFGQAGERFTYNLMGIAVPEPTALGLLCAGLLALVHRRRRGN
jgi:hypothetical protein